MKIQYVKRDQESMRLIAALNNLSQTSEYELMSTALVSLELPLLARFQETE